MEILILTLLMFTTIKTGKAHSTRPTFSRALTSCSTAACVSGLWAVRSV